MDKKFTYICDPKKNVNCPKDICQALGRGECIYTSDPRFAVNPDMRIDNTSSIEKKQTNQDKLAEKLRNMNPKDLAGFIVDCTALGECPNCPAFNYCERYYCTDKDDLKRIPDENGETLSCEEIFERWLKEEAKEDTE